ncbi:MAG TPA: DpnI domain-containing protein [Acetobacteraceae bacterium]|nr:DpnI domain-containing protein [Acetobacteraceae bacterium]
MDLSFQAALAGSYKSSLQRIRILSEDWVHRQVYCPSCGHIDMGRYGNNRPVADFFCHHCDEDYELKSQSKTFGAKMVDGAYRTMMDRLKGSSNPNLLLLHYDPRGLSVQNLLVIPKYFFVPEIIEERKPLSPFARRAGWVGCNISLQGIPQAGRIFLIRDRIIEPKDEVLARWQKTLFLRDQRDVRAKGWLLGVMRCIENIKKSTFTIEELYQFENELKMIYPSNRHIREKIRQKLQILRDKGYLHFLGKGTYRLVPTNVR